MMAASRSRRAASGLSSSEGLAAGRSTSVRSSLSRRKAMAGWAMASRRSASATWPDSVRGSFRNFRRAGVAKKSSRTSTRVPGGCAAGRGSPLAPPSMSRLQAVSAPAGREVSTKRLTEAIEGSASPRKPRVRMSLRSSSGSLEVQWRSTASAISSRVMPTPSSTTERKLRPPSFRTTAMRWAPASIAFSTSSLTALAGRSTTSPAAMRLTKVEGRRRSALMARPFYARRRGERYWRVRILLTTDPT